MKHIFFVLFLSLAGTVGFSQDSSPVKESTYTVGKEIPVKNFLPGAGTLKGNVQVLDLKTAVPLAFIDVEKVKRIQSDKKGYFEIELDTGTYNIIISSAGYEDLVIVDFVIKWGKEKNIVVSLANSEGFKKN